MTIRLTSPSTTYAAASPPPSTPLPAPPALLSGHCRRHSVKFRSSGYFDDGSPASPSSSSSSSRSQFDLFPVSYPSAASFPARFLLNGFPSRVHSRRPVLPVVRCENKDDSYKYVSVERPPYYIYMDSTSGQLEPASGARASIPGPEYWSEGTAERVRAARAPEPKGVSGTGEPSYGKRPGSRRKGYKASAASVDSAGTCGVGMESLSGVVVQPEQSDSELVVYQTEPLEEELTQYELDKKLGRPHPFIDPEKRRLKGKPLTSEELWWNWRKPEGGHWSRWQKRRPDAETVFLKAMAESRQIKLFGEHPTIAETTLYRARRHLYKEERLKAEQERLERIGPLAYYSEWVKAWKRDTSHAAVRNHFEETGEDENTQLIEMFCHQTDREYRIMMGTDVRIRRDPLAMRMREDQIKQIWGGDPVYPTINYIQDPNQVTDFRAPEFHEPTPSMLDYLMECGKVIPRKELEQILAKEKKVELKVTDIDDAMARAVDIGETDDGEESDMGDEDESEEKLSRNWSVLKSTPQLSKSKEKPKKAGPMLLEEAIEESENLTDFLMDFDEDEET